MVDVSTGRLNAASQATYKLDYEGGLRAATGLALDANGICQKLYQKDLNACGFELLGDGTSGGLLTSHALVLDGTSGCWCTTPDAVSLDIVGDIDIRVEGQMWPGGPVTQTFVSKWNPTGNQRSYKMQALFGFVSLHWSNDGTADLSDDQVFPPSFTGAWRVTLDVVNGANHVSEYSYATSLGAGTPFDTNTVAGNTAIFSGSAVLGIGSSGAAGVTDPFLGRITRVEVRNGLGGAVVANPDFRNLATGTTSFVDGAGLTWTVQGTARIV